MRPARELLRERAAAMRAATERNLVRDGLAPAEASWRARVLIAAVDGIQIQWLLDPSIDMADDIVRLNAVLTAPPGP